MKHARKCVVILRELFTHIWAKLIAGRAKTLGKYTAVILETCFEEYIRYMKYMTNNRLLWKNKINCLLKSAFCCCFVTYSARDHFVYLFIFSFLLSFSLSCQISSHKLFTDASPQTKTDEIKARQMTLKKPSELAWLAYCRVYTEANGLFLIGAVFQFWAGIMQCDA